MIGLFHTFERANQGGGGYKPGDVIVIVPDNHVFSAHELTLFFALKFPTDQMPLGDWYNLCQPQHEGEGETYVQLRHRRYYFDLTKLEAIAKPKLLSTTDYMPVQEGYNAADFIDKEAIQPRFAAI